MSTAGDPLTITALVKVPCRNGENGHHLQHTNVRDERFSGDRRKETEAETHRERDTDSAENNPRMWARLRSGHQRTELE